MFKKLRTWDLFSGIGGFGYSLKSVTKTILYCKIDKTANTVLQQNMEKGLLTKAYIAPDIRELTCGHSKNQPEVDLVLCLCGFPCVGFSTAGT